MNVISKTKVDSFDRKHSRIAMFGSSYAACFYSIKEHLPFPIDFYCSRGTLIHSIELDIDNKFYFNPTEIGIKDPDWIQTIYSNSISTNQFSSPTDYKSFIIFTKLDLDLYKLFLNTQSDRLNMHFSRELIATILENYHTSNIIFARQFESVRLFANKLKGFNKKAKIFCFPSPTQIDQESGNAHMLHQSKKDIALINTLHKQVEEFYSTIYNFQIRLPPVKVITQNLKMKREYCTINKESRWNGLLRRGHQNENLGRYVEETDRHRNKLYALANNELLKSLCRSESH